MLISFELQYRVDDMLELENMNPIPDEEGGNAYLVNGNMVSIRFAMQDHSLHASEPEKETTEDKHDGDGDDDWWNDQKDGDAGE